MTDLEGSTPERSDPSRVERTGSEPRPAPPAPRLLLRGPLAVFRRPIRRPTRD